MHSREAISTVRTRCRGRLANDAGLLFGVLMESADSWRDRMILHGGFAYNDASLDFAATIQKTLNDFKLAALHAAEEAT
jgi:hypothetical protein